MELNGILFEKYSEFGAGICYKSVSEFRIKHPFISGHKIKTHFMIRVNNGVIDAPGSLTLGFREGMSFTFYSNGNEIETINKLNKLLGVKNGK
ncbi:MAG: hypothetical protein FWG20_05735 [Candidatus Cloacimonetes bacterium]|nr:hypothetical protein [Candidatus Cloacimonadota bacterium]